MSPLRERRLLMLATQPANHKAFYAQYCFLAGHGLTRWIIGSAYLAPAGAARLIELVKAGI